MQMLGRAGRPQFDKSGTAVIMTTTELGEKYTQLISGQETIESQLHENLVEHLCAEIALGTITSVESASAWLNSTFLAVRLRSNPSRYRLPNEDKSMQHSSVAERLRALCERNIQLLTLHDLVTDANGRTVATRYGETMSRQYLKLGSCDDVHYMC
jgi:ATP-dependent DNA helicase HFM1/MER3